MQTKFRAVITIFGDTKILEIRFDGLNEENTRMSVKLIPNNRHDIDPLKFFDAFLNLTSAINRYAKNVHAKMIIGKMLGMM